MAKKVAFSATIDGDVLRGLDNLLRQIQTNEIKSRKPLSTRSSLIERLVRDGVAEAEAH